MAPEQKPAVQSSVCSDATYKPLFWPHSLYSALSPIIYRMCMQSTGDAHFNVLRGCGSAIGLMDTGEKIAFGSAFPGSWQGKRIYRRSRAHMCWRKGCTYPCSPHPFPHLWPREWVFLSFAGRVLLAAVFSSCCLDLGRACQAMACHTGKMRRWIRQKKQRRKAAESQGQLTAGLAKPHVCRVQEHCQIHIIQEF